MFLEYGVNVHNELVYIHQVGRGRVGLHCPYCGGDLVAKKGRVKAPHFAHAGETCRAAQRHQDAISLPAYDRFDLHIPGHALQDLARVKEGELDFADSPDGRYLERLGLATYNDFARARRGAWELTKKGKIPFGDLSLPLFCEVQEPMLMGKHAELEYLAVRARGTGEFDMRLSDLRIYRAQWRRLLLYTLYFLEIHHAGGLLHKIGVTTRPIEARVAEIEADLRPLLGEVKITVLGTWPHRGNVEHYFKHRYRQFHVPLGTLSEYFAFPDAKPVLSYDLRRMKPKQLTDLEQAVMLGLPSAFEQQMEQEAIEQRRREGIRRGLARAKQRGQAVGRPPRGETTADFLVKPKNAAIRAALVSGLGVRETARALRVSVNTVRKVHQAMQEMP